MCPHAIIFGEKDIYFNDNHYKFFEHDELEENILVNATSSNLDPFVYDLKKRGKDTFKKLERSRIHCCWLCVEEDENVDLVVEYEGDDLVEEDEDLVETQ